MKIGLTLLSIGMIAAAATAADHVVSDVTLTYTGNGLRQDKGQEHAATINCSDRLWSTDFNGYTTGTVCTDMTSAKMGQDMWSQYQTGSGNRWSIITQTSGKALKGAWGSNTASGAYSYLYQDNGQSGYYSWTIGSSIQVNFQLERFSNTISTNKGQTQIRTYNASGTQTTIGFIFDNYATGTNPSIRGLAHLNTGSAATTGTYAFTLATGSEVTQAGTHAYYTAYDIKTGMVYWGWDIGTPNETGFYFFPAASGYLGGANQDPVNEVDFINNRNSSTTIGNQVVDNIAIYIPYLTHSTDCNRNGFPDWWESLADCNNNGMADVCEIALEYTSDCNNNSIPDSCEIVNSLAQDCNSNGILDSCEIANGTIDDNGDGRLDTCQRAKGDLDLNGSVDTGDVSIVLLYYGEVNPPFGDFDGNGIVDTGDVSWLLLNFGPVTWP
jgi:hypothetical protein